MDIDKLKFSNSQSSNRKNATKPSNSIGNRVK